MQETSNAASRVLALVGLFAKQPPDKPALRGWATAFGIEGDGPRVEDEVTLALHAMRGEIDLIEQQLSGKEVPPAVYAVWLSKCRNGCSTTRLHQATKDVLQDVGRAELLLVLQWASWALRSHDEKEVDEAALKELLAQMAELEAALSTAPLTAYGRDFVARQIAIIKTAIRLYRIKGGKALRDGFGSVAAAYKIEEAAIKREVAHAPPEGKGVVSRLFEGVKKVGELCDAASKIGDGVDKAIGMGHSVLPWIDDALKLFPSLGGPS